MGAHATSLSYMSMPVWRGFPAAFSCGRAARQESNTRGRNVAKHELSSPQAPSALRADRQTA